MIKQTSFNTAQDHEQDGPVECLGMTFPNDQARRDYFLQKLREKLQDPEFRTIEGFPIGTDEDILALSDPPYYTACPNPFITDFIATYGKPYDPNEPYSKEPFAADVSEGKNDPIYNAHSYHTKVPHKAIMRYILHYTKPGDIVLDGFCGTGMTGVAAQMCGAPDDEFRKHIEQEWKKSGWDEPIWGVRRTVLSDLSPAATFIAYNYNKESEKFPIEQGMNRILAEVKGDFGWMYETNHSDGSKGHVKFIIWSDVFLCPECQSEIIFWDVAVDKNAGAVFDVFPCPKCYAQLTKRSMNKKWVTNFDVLVGENIQQVEQVPVLVNYSVGNRRFEKTPDNMDIEIIDRIESNSLTQWFPSNLMPTGDKTSDPFGIGITRSHHFYTRRNLVVLSEIWKRLELIVITMVS